MKKIMAKKKWAIPALVVAFAMGYFSSVYAGQWVQDGSKWKYKNDNGKFVTNEWQRGGDNLWRWIGSDGVMATSTWVDNRNYFVDEKGVMVSNNWVKATENGKSYWYYFNSKGEKQTSMWRKNGDSWFYLDDEGRVQTGWVDDDRYYCDENGAMATGWRKIAPADKIRVKNVPGESDDGKRWHYFGKDGKKYQAKSGSKHSEYKIDGATYSFNEDGYMDTGWVNLKESSNAKIKDFRYYNSDGTMRKGWYSLKPPTGIKETYLNNVEWFYFNRDGKPESSESESHLRSTGLKKINGLTYIFRSNGTPVYGLRRVYTSDDNYDVYYFGTQAQSNVQKGKQEVKEAGGATAEYYFENNGKGYTGVHDGKLYYKGKLQVADKASKYIAISIPQGNGRANYVINSNGRVSKNTTATDNNKVKYKTDKKGILIEYDGSKSGVNGRFESPQEPDVMDY